MFEVEADWSNKELVVGSLDVRALYPRLMVDKTTQLVSEAILASDINAGHVEVHQTHSRGRSHQREGH